MALISNELLPFLAMRKILPANTCQDVEDSDKLDAVPAEPEPTQHHLSKAKDRTESREDTNRHQAQNIEEEDHKASIRDSEIEERLSQQGKGERRDDHVRR